MKKIFFIMAVFLLSVSAFTQGNSGSKGKDKQKDKAKTSQTDNPGKSKDKDKEKQKEDKAKNDEHDRKVWDGIDDKNGSCMKPSKNQPAKVRASFQKDYPNAVNARWTKCRGDWTATFGNGLYMSTAVYHANGDRRDTRTPIVKENLPKRVFDEIFKRKPDSRLEDAIKIEVPNAVKEIFRIKNVIEGKTEFIHFDSDGLLVNYNY